MMESPTQHHSTSTKGASSTSGNVAKHAKQDQARSRKRISSSHMRALQRMFDVKPNPSREERGALASELDMEIKSVSIWFRNRRQVIKRQGRSSKENAPPSTQHSASRQKSGASMKSSDPRPLRANVSLDRIARLSERPSSDTNTSFCVTPPHSPSRESRASPPAPFDTSKIWQLMPSSPEAPLSSPCVDTARLPVVPRHSWTTGSLEWACAKARMLGTRDDGQSLDMGPLSPDSDSTEIDVDEVLTPDGSMDLSPSPPWAKCKSFTFENNGRFTNHQSAKPIHPSEDIEAAMSLLHLMRQG